jgi:hypothetical protein
MTHITVYIDTNCINSLKKIDALNELEKLHEEEKIAIEKTDTLDTELQQNSSKNANRLKKSMNYIESYGAGVWDNSRWDHSVWGDTSDETKLTRMLEILWGKKVRSAYTRQELRDGMHIQTASRYGGTYFVTQEKALIAKSEIIEKEFTIKVVSPDDCLAKINKRLRELEELGYDITK